MSNQTDLLREAVELLRALADHNVTYWSDDGEARFNPGKNQADSMRIFREARAFLAKIDAAEVEESTVPDVTTEDAPSWYNSDMAIAWVVGYEAAQDALAASARQDGAR